MNTDEAPNLRNIKTPDEPGPDVPKLQRQAWLYEKVMEMGHPSLIDKVEVADKFDVSRRQVYYDLDDVAKSVQKYDLADDHIGKNLPVFEKAKREALREGDWQGAVNILKEQAAWLEDRGELDKEPDQHEMTWRHYVEDGNNDEPDAELDDPNVIDI